MGHTLRMQAELLESTLVLVSNSHFGFRSAVVMSKVLRTSESFGPEEHLCQWKVVHSHPVGSVSLEGPDKCNH